MIKINMYPAEDGDAFLISFGEDNDNNIIVDMGLSNTYENHIKQDLQKLKTEGKRIDLLVITHTDRDHIEGAIKFIDENDQSDEIINIKEIWYNSYRHLQFDKQQETVLLSNEKNILTEIIGQNSTSSIDNGYQDVSIGQGITLASLLYRYSYNWNTCFSGLAAILQDDTIQITPEITIKIISPSQSKLTTLENKWKRELLSRKYGFTFTDDKFFDDAFECYMKYEQEHTAEVTNTSTTTSSINIRELIDKEERDKSVTNGASLAFIIEYKGKKLLFLGDAHEDLIYNQLQMMEDLNFDLVKVSHHGSNKNISNRLLNIIKSKRFLISTNGDRHQHPDLSTIAKIIVTDYEKDIVFNYNHPKLEELKKQAEIENYKFNFITNCNFILLE